jgi:hypothetical protein
MAFSWLCGLDYETDALPTELKGLAGEKVGIASFCCL